MRIGQLKFSLLALGVSACLSLTGCADMQVGGGKNPVGGSAGGATSTGAATTLEHCDHSLGTLAVEENTGDPWYAVLTGQYHLPSTVPLIRLMVQQSNCFVVVDRGQAMNSMMGERSLAASGELRTTSNMGRGQMVAADYVVTPSIQFSQNTGGGAAALAGVAGGYGAIIGAVAGSMKTSEASTTMMLTDTRSGVQVAAAQGSAKNTDFGAGGLFGRFGSGGAAMGAYSQTPEGKVIAAAFLDSYNQMVKSVRQYAPQHVAGGLGNGGSLAVDGASNPTAAAYSLADAQRKLSQLGLYTSKVDGMPGPGTTRAISTFQKANGLPVTGQLDAATASALQAR
ncbi:peptidoglycan-binding protein [Dyella choica]|uniref:Peptidoglycan-binding protein n=1 Tax=Dyella choica TaxID=1927959 RepID=A0A432M8Z0_9GAMM|nr:peptidoglycan-binding protein [Dyella choica]RUL78379.1 peptidoglycan-binding protein [Dyella choica]